MYALIKVLMKVIIFILTLHIYPFHHPVDIGPVTISQPIMATIGESVSLQCSANITPQNSPSPEFEWFFGSTNKSHLLSTNTTRNSGNTYTSTLKIAMVGESDEGMYTCRLRGNQRTAVSTMITVNPGA